MGKIFRRNWDKFFLRLTKKRFLVVLGVILATIGVSVYFSKKEISPQPKIELTDNPNLNFDDGGGLENTQHPLSIEFLRQGNYPGSDIVIEETLSPGSNYKKYIASYKSEGLKIYGLLTVPNPSTGADDDNKGYPAIVFNHGYIPPAQYKTTERYLAYTDAFAKNGYVVFKPDYRGHGDSQGEPSGAYGASAYTIDILNAVASIKKLKDPLNVNSQELIVNPEGIGMWGHSLGGYITLRNMVISRDIKAGVIWAGVVGSYPDLIERWRRRITPFPTLTGGRGRWRQELISKYGQPHENPEFWNSISANSYLADISGPLQLHHGTSDASVPIEFSQKLYDQMRGAGKEVEFLKYEEGDHNLSKNLSSALRKSVDFFDKYLK